jgi:hypothetical protein
MLKINFLLPPTIVAIASVVATMLVFALGRQETGTATIDAAGLKPLMGGSRDGSDIRNAARTSHQGRFF